MLTSTQNASSHCLYQQGGVPERYAASAPQFGVTVTRLVDSKLRRVRIMLVDDQIRLVVTNIRTIDRDAARDGVWLQTKQGFVQLGAIVRKVQSRNP